MTSTTMQANPFLRRQDEPEAPTPEEEEPTFLEQIQDEGAFDVAIESSRETLSATLAWLMDPAVWASLIVLFIHIIIIVALAFGAIRVIDKITDRWTKGVEDLPANHPKRQRTQTISNLISSSGRYIIWPIALIMLLSQVDIDIAALLATAGIAGLAIGFGAQTLVKDVIGGIFLLFDDTIHVGDFVIIGDQSGIVEHIGVRIIKVRKFDGELLMVPSGELRIFGNRSIEFARVVVPVDLSYEQDLDTILPVMEQIADEWSDEHHEIMIDDEPTVQAITAFNASSITARIVCAVKPGEQFQAERDLRRQIKERFDKLGVEIPFSRRTVYMREEKDLPPRKVAAPSSPEVSGDAHGSD